MHKEKSSMNAAVDGSVFLVHMFSTAHFYMQWISAKYLLAGSETDLWSRQMMIDAQYRYYHCQTHSCLKPSR